MNEQKNEIIEEEVNIIVVHVTGQVINPGIVRLKEGSRVIDAINKAGGTTSDANLSLINLAYRLEDGEKIYVPSYSDEEEYNLIQSQEKTDKPIRVNINSANEEKLEQVPGIGSSIASRIIEYRKENGKFESIEDIKNVSGIGESKFSSIKQYLYVK